MDTAILDVLPHPVVVVDATGAREYANHEAHKVLGGLRDTAAARAVNDIAWGAVDSDGNPLPADRLPSELTRTTGVQFTDVEVGFPAGDELRWLRITTRRLSDDLPCRVLVTCADVDATRRIHERHETIIDALHEGVVIQDGDGVIVAANPSAQALLGLSRDELLGLTAVDSRWQAVDAEGAPLTGEQHPSSIARRTQEPIYGAIMGVRSSTQALKWLRVNALPLISSDGNRDGVVATFVDITEQPAYLAQTA